MKNIPDTAGENLKTHILCLLTFYRKSCCLWHNVEKYGAARQATNGNMAYAHIMLDN